MKFIKALCVVLLVYSACSGERRTLENNPKLKVIDKVEKKLAKRMAQKLEQLVRQADKGLSGNNKQFGYIYIQAYETDDLSFDDSAVGQALLVNRRLPPTAYAASTWPLLAGNTNFRMAVPDFKKPKQSNYGHFEYQLIANNKFGEMLKNFVPRHLFCPQFVILYSTLLPCMYPPKNSEYHGPRCADMAVTAKNTLHKSCPEANFYLYTDQVSLGKKLRGLLQDILNYFKENEVIWINPNREMYK